MQRLLLTISRANGINSELFKDVIGVLEQALSTSCSTVAPTSRCHFCLLAPEITRYDTCFVFEILTYCRISIAESVQTLLRSMSQLSMENLSSECRTLKVLLQVSVHNDPSSLRYTVNLNLVNHRYP